MSRYYSPEESFTVDFFPRCKNEIRVSPLNTICGNTTTYFYAGQAFDSITELFR